MDDLRSALEALLVIGVANSTPVLASHILGDRLARPLDFGCRLPDGQPIFGAHKTWRGLASGMAASTLAGWAVGIGAGAGAAAGFLALAGDAISSSIKRRLRRAPGADLPGVDQLPEVLLPLLLLRPIMDLSLAAMCAVITAFVLLDLASAPLRRFGASAQRAGTRRKR